MKKELTDRQYKAYHVQVSFWLIVTLPISIIFKVLKEIYITFKFAFAGKIKQKKQILNGKKIITSKEFIDYSFKKLDEQKSKKGK